MANPSLVSGTVNSGSASSGSSVTVSSNGSVAANDLMVVVMAVESTAGVPASFSPPSGWTTALAATRIDSLDAAVAIFWKFQTTAGSFSGSFSWANATDGMTWIFSEWTGVNQTTPLDGSVADAQGTTTTPSSPSVTPTTGNTQDTLICCVFGATLTTTTVTVPSGMSTVKNVSGSSTALAAAMASLALSSASATGTKQWTLSLSQDSLVVSWLLQPPAAVASFIPPRPRTRIVERRILRKVA
jgi:hypothetical protein